MADIQTTHRSAGAKKTLEDWRGSVIVGAANYLRLAATPTFAIMAFLTSIGGSPGHGASPLTGMVAMYLLMSVFHSPPWLKLIRTHHAVGEATR
jgi:hypothetical protein